MNFTGLINLEYVNTVIRKRPQEIHKGDCGKVLIIAGSKEMAGAAVFAATAAIKSGSGLVKVCTKKKIFPVIQGLVPEAICISWGSAKTDLQQYDAIAVGPGMGVGRRTKRIIEKLLTEYNKPLIIDADGLNTIAKYDKLKKLVRNSNSEIIITPHVGEGKRLLTSQRAEEKLSSVEALDRKEMAQKLENAYKTITILKGAGTIVATDEKNAYINTTGNSGMATAGSGDVLTGVITSLAGQGLDPEDAAKAGVFVHGLAGDIAAEAIGEYGVTATEIAQSISFAILDILESQED